MKKLQILINLKSPLLLGSGNGWGGANIDTDIVFDQYGLPYFPARRLKGMLRESAVEVVEMFELASLKGLRQDDIDAAFGKKGSNNGSPLLFNNLMINGYDETVKWLEWAYNNYSFAFSAETVLNSMTEIRYFTEINNNGTARDNSLRSARVLNAGHSFKGNILLDDTDDEQGNIIKLLALACANLRRAGSKRTRGLGEIECSLWDGGRNLSAGIIQELRGELGRA